MSPDEFLAEILRQNEAAGNLLIAETVMNDIRPHVEAWANGHLMVMKPSGSLAKGTAILGASDVDILVSVRWTAIETLSQVYQTLYNRLQMVGYNPRKQNVSLGINVRGFKVDVVPAKRQNILTTDHSLWSHKQSTHRTTNIDGHIDYVTQSMRMDEIKLVKIWALKQSVEFPSFPLEVAVISALEGNASSSLAANFITIIEYIRDNIQSRRIIDPTKPSNILSDELTEVEKSALADKSIQTLGMTWQEAFGLV